MNWLLSFEIVFKDEVHDIVRSSLKAIKVSDRGVYVQASTLGSLEALLEFLKTSKIPVFHPPLCFDKFSHIVKFTKLRRWIHDRRRWLMMSYNLIVFLNWSISENTVRHLMNAPNVVPRKQLFAVFASSHNLRNLTAKLWADLIGNLEVFLHHM